MIPVSIHHRWRLLGTLAATAILLAVGDPAPRTLGAEAGAEASPIRFRRVYPPANRVADWPRGQHRYIPMDIHEFEALAAASAGPARSEAAVLPATLRAAEYHLWLDSPELLRGEGRLSVEHTGEGPALVSLAPCNLALESPAWWHRDDVPQADAAAEGDDGQGDDGPMDPEDADRGRAGTLGDGDSGEVVATELPADAESDTGGGEPSGVASDEGGRSDASPAVLGQTPEGTLGLLVEEAGDLRFHFSRRGRRDAAGGKEFTLEVPACPTSHLLLDLPEALVPVVDVGVVLDEGAADETTRRWRLVLGGRHRVRLRLVERGALDTPPRTVTYRQTSTYDVTPRGIEVRTALRLFVRGEPLQRLHLVLDAGLQPVGAQLGDEATSYSVWMGEEGEQHVLVEFAEPLLGSGRVVQLTALAPLVLDRPWLLPRIRAADAEWESSVTTLAVLAPILLTEFVPVEAAQTRAAPLPAPGDGETVEMRLFSPEATARIVLSHPTAPPQVTTGAVVQLANQLTARVHGHLTMTQGRRFSVTGEVSPRWIVDSVESLDGEAIEDWSIERTADGSRRLSITLARGLSPERPLRLTVSMRSLESPLERNMTLGELEPLRFETPTPGRYLLALEAAEPYELRTPEPEPLSAAEAEALEEEFEERFDERPGGPVFRLHPATADLRVALHAHRPRYAGRIEVEAAVTDEWLRQSYTFRCTPESVRVERVRVQFAMARPAPLQWSMEGGDARDFSARLLSADERSAAGLALGGEVWQITLREPQNEPFTLRASRTTPSSDGQALNLAGLPEASAQRGTLLVRALQAAPLRIQNHRLEPLPAEPPPEGAYQTLRAAFQYDPVRDAVPASEPTVTVSLTPNEVGVAAAWVWLAELESQYEADGSGRHLASFRLENAGRESVSIALPPRIEGTQVRAVWVDDERTAWDRGGEGRAVLVGLPAGRRFPVVAVQFDTTGGRLRALGSLTPPWADADVPILARRWTVWLPPGFESPETDLRWQQPRGPRSSWSQRLFGPLGRDAESGAFDPLSVSDWARLAGNESLDAAARQRADQLLRRMGSLVGGEGDGAAVEDWADLLEQVVHHHPEIPLLVDDRALGRLAIGPGTPLERLPFYADRTERAVALLHHAGLALLIHPHALVITGAAEAALDEACRPCDEEPNRCWVRPGPLFDEIDAALEAGAAGGMVPAEGWRNGPPRPPVPWTVARQGRFRPADTLGWSAYRLETPPGEKGPRLRIVHRDTVLALRWLVFLGGVGLGWWLAAGRPVVLAVTAGMAATAALLLPAAYATAFSGALLAALFCLLVHSLTGWGWPAAAGTPKEAAAPQAPATLPSTAKHVVAGTIACILAAAAGAARGEETEARETVYQVFIPVDEQFDPVGETCFVPEPLYVELLRRSAARPETPQGWLINEAVYRGTLVRGSGPELLSIAEIRAGFDLTVLGQSVRVRLPFGREGVTLVPDSATLDGRPVEPEWSDEGALVFAVAEPGQYRLQMRLQPTPLADARSAGFDLAIPPVANARCELALPAGMAGVEVPAAAGAAWVESSPPRLVADLGAVERLSVRWPQSGPRTAAEPVVDAEELLWLHASPTSVSLRGRLRLRVTEGTLREVLLSVDPRLRLNLPEPSMQVEPGTRHTIRLSLEEGVSDQTVLDLPFTLQEEASGVGTLRLPDIELLNARRTRRWLAVSLDPALEHDPPPDGVAAMAIQEFLAAWGDVEGEPPVAAFDLGEEPAEWTLATRLAAPRTEGEAVVRVSFGPEAAEVRLEARLQTEGGSRWSYRIRPPAGMEVDSISLVKDGLERVRRWAVGDDGRLNVFLAAAVDGPQALTLSGRLPAPRRGTRSLALPHLAEVDLTALTLELYRQPGVLVEVESVAGMTEAAEQGLAGGRSEWGRLLARFAADLDAAPALNVALAPNRPRVHAEQTTLLSSTPEGWQAEIEAKLECADGLLDEIRFLVPPQMTGPYEVSPTSAIETQEAGDDWQQLVVRPQRPIDSSYRVTLTSPLTVAPGDRPAVPRVELVQADSLQHVVLLPQESDGEEISWEFRGLKPIALPEGSAARTGGAPYDAFEVTTRSFQAVLSRPDPLGGNPQVALAEVSAAWHADGSVVGTAVFDVDPVGRATCPLNVPEGFRLVHVAVEGVPITPIPVGGGAADPAHPSSEGEPARFLVPLGPRRLPQRVEVVFAGSAAMSNGGTLVLETPWPGNLRVRQTLYSITAPPHSLLGSESAEPVRPLDGELRRLRAMTELVEEASFRVPGEDEAAAHWLRPWARRMARSDAAARRLLAREPVATRRRVLAELESVAEQQAQVAQRLGASTAAAEGVDEDGALEEAILLWAQVHDPAREPLRLAFEGSAASVTLSHQRSDRGESGGRAAAVAAVLALTAAVVAGVRRGTFHHLLLRWPAAVGVGLGLVWWLWMAPSIVGLAIVAASLALAVRWTWRGEAPADASSVIRLD